MALRARFYMPMSVWKAARTGPWPLNAAGIHTPTTTAATSWP